MTALSVNRETKHSSVPSLGALKDEILECSFFRFYFFRKKRVKLLGEESLGFILLEQHLDDWIVSSEDLDSASRFHYVSLFVLSEKRRTFQTLLCHQGMNAWNEKNKTRSEVSSLSEAQYDAHGAFPFIPRFAIVCCIWIPSGKLPIDHCL